MYKYKEAEATSETNVLKKSFELLEKASSGSYVQQLCRTNSWGKKKIIRNQEAFFRRPSYFNGHKRFFFFLS